MPYTPPAQQSPAAASPHSPPHHSRQSCFSDSPPRSPGPHLHLPRSHSQSYFHRPRRGPSHLGHGDHSPLPDSGTVDKHSLHINTNIRQSPPPQSDALMPPGAMISPPESAQNSSDDEDNGSKSSADLDELSEAVRRSIVVKRDGSPPEDYLTVPGEGLTKSASDSQLSAMPAGLSPSARKITHSRSSSENVLYSPSLPQSQAASDEDDDEDLPFKPPLVRKKSGELVKPAIRPKSRRKPSSMPGTPTYAKNVHFNNDHMTQVRHFLQVDKPIAVSAGTSPVEAYDDQDEFPFSKDATDLEMTLSNFPRESMERLAQPVRLESLTLSHDQKSLIGVVAVANLAFHKHVAARFTFDYWKTTSEVVAEFSSDPRHAGRTDGYDPFSFSIKLADQSNVGNKTLLLCMRYFVNNTEYWDNNAAMNFQVDFAKKPRLQSSTGPGAGMPPRSRRSSGAHRHSRPNSLPTNLEDDFSLGVERGIQFRNGMQSGAPSLAATPPARRTSSSAQQFGNRYDFGASLSAALSHAQATLGDRSGIRPKKVPQPQPIVPAPPKTDATPHTVASALSRTVQSKTGGTDSPQHDSLLANKQSVDSRAYQEFVSKFCFFGSKSSPPVQTIKGPDGRDGANDADSFFGAGPGPEVADDTSAANNGTPLDQRVSGFAGLFPPQLPSPIASGSNSPLRTGSNDTSDRPSPMNFGYPFEQRNGFWSGSVTPPAIRG